MAIIASTSPEIKALNLPITPCFPQALDYGHHRVNSNDTNSSFSSVSTSSSRPKGSLSPLLAAMDDDMDASPDQHDPFGSDAMHIYFDETDDLIHSFRNHDLNAATSSRDEQVKFPKKAMHDKENIHPNLLQPQLHINHRSRPFQVHQKTHYARRSSFHSSYSHSKATYHRRASCDSLPSPDQIGNFPRVMRRASGSPPMLPRDFDRQRSDSCLVSRNLNLTTEFRWMGSSLLIGASHWICLCCFNSILWLLEFLNNSYKCITITV